MHQDARTPVRQIVQGQTTRRQFLRRAGMLLMAPTAVSLLAATATTVPALAMAPARPAAAAQPLKVRLKVAEPSPLFSVDAQRQTGEVRQLYSYAQGLTGSNGAGEVVPWLAERWSVSADNTQYTFTLRQGVRFHNGDPLTPADVKWSIERQMDPKTKARRYADLQNVASVQVVDSSTLTITLKQPFAPFQASLVDSFILSPRSEMNADGEITLPIGTGPFKFVEWVPDRSLVLERFSGYWEPGVPVVDELEILTIPDASGRLSALLAGDVDAIMAYPSSEVATAATNIEIAIAFANAPRWWAYTFNLDSLRPPFDNKEVRRAIAMAVDKEAVRQLFTFGLGQVTNEFYAPGQFWNLGIPDPFALPNLDGARSILAAQGVPQGQGIKLIAPNVFDIDRLVLILEDKLRAVGFNPTTELSDWTSYSDRLEKAADWDMSGMGISFKLDPSIDFNFFNPSDGGAFFLGGGWNNPQFLSLLQSAASTPDPAARKEFYRQAYMMMQDEVPTILAVYDRQIWGYRVQLKNWNVGISDYHFADGGFARATLET